MDKKKAQFTAAYEEHADALFRFSFFKLSDRELAQDTLQETFTKTWLFIAKGGKVDNFKAFLYRTMSNLIIDEYRKRKPIDSLETMGEDGGFEAPFDDTESWFNKADGERAMKLIGQIPDPYNEAVFMRYVEDLSLQEIAEITGETENAISVRVHRGLEKLKKLYNHE